MPEKKIKKIRIRIYMGKYPMNHPKNRMAKPEYAGYQTIFLVPTAQKEKERRPWPDQPLPKKTQTLLQ